MDCNCRLPIDDAHGVSRQPCKVVRATPLPDASAARRSAASDRATSSAVVAQLLTEMRSTARPCHSEPVIQAVQTVGNREFSDEELWRDWYWEERFPDWTALRRYFRHVDEKWDLSRDIRFGTRLDTATWDDRGCFWRLQTDDGLTLDTRFLVLCTGFATKAYVPDLPGLDEFTGRCHHTAHWPQDGLDLTGLRVGVIGTGASGVQVIQEAAKVAASLTVFQRTPIMALAMRQRGLTRAEQDEAKTRYPDIFRARTETFAGFDIRSRDASALDLSDRDRRAGFEEMWQAGGFTFWAGNYSDVMIDEAANRTAYYVAVRHAGAWTSWEGGSDR